MSTLRELVGKWRRASDPACNAGDYARFACAKDLEKALSNEPREVKDASIIWCPQCHAAIQVHILDAEAALRAETPAPREPKLTISDLDEILGGYDSADVTRGTVLQRLNEWLRIRAAGELEQAK